MPQQCVMETVAYNLVINTMLQTEALCCFLFFLPNYHFQLSNVKISQSQALKYWMLLLLVIDIHWPITIFTWLLLFFYYMKILNDHLSSVSVLSIVRLYVAGNGVFCFTVHWFVLLRFKVIWILHMSNNVANATSW